MGNLPNTTNVPIWARSWCSGGINPARHENASHVERVFVSGWRVDGVGGGEPAEHEKRALWGVFFVFGWSGGTAGGGEGGY